jgi:hypothetical protein
VVLIHQNYDNTKNAAFRQVILWAKTALSLQKYTSHSGIPLKTRAMGFLSEWQKNGHVVHGML